MPRRSVIQNTSGSNVQNMTLVIVIILLFVVGYLFYRISYLGKNETKSSGSYLTGLLPPNHSQHVAVTNAVSSVPIQDVRGDVGRCNAGGGTIGDPLTNAYVPPIKCDGGGLMNAPLMMTVPGNSVPINVPTQHYNTQYNQIGIISKQGAHNNEILPLMGRRTVTSRDKWQYYTVSGGGPGGNLQAKLPVKVKGRNCSGEYGCEEILNGDDVYVEGYNDTFRATIYENGLFSYIP